MIVKQNFAEKDKMLPMQEKMFCEHGEVALAVGQCQHFSPNCNPGSLNLQVGLEGI